MNDDLEDGLLDDAGKSRRFIHSHAYNENDNAHSVKSSKKTIQKRTRITKEIKYGYHTASNSSQYELSTADLIRIASGYKQAILKITSFGKGLDKIYKHLAYITRDFDLPAEDQEQSLIHSAEESNDLLSSWNAIYFDHHKNSRNTMHMVLSAPPNTCRDRFKQLTREFLQEEFGGQHDYLFVAHNDTEHPHIHSVICLRSVEGYKLNPRKQYLHLLRKNFAKKCREHGLMVEASRRFERGLAGQSLKSPLVQMRNRNVIPAVDKALAKRVQEELLSKQSADTGKEQRQLRNHAVKNRFYKTAKKLFEQHTKNADSPNKDNSLMTAKLLLDFSKHFPSEMSKDELLKEKFIAKSSSLTKDSNFLGLYPAKNQLNKNSRDLGLGETD